MTGVDGCKAQCRHNGTTNDGRKQTNSRKTIFKRNKERKQKKSKSRHGKYIANTTHHTHIAIPFNYFHVNEFNLFAIDLSTKNFFLQSFIRE